jgi:hypothetical protein
MKLSIVHGVEGHSVYLNGYRIAGPKPWGGGTTVKEFEIEEADVRTALLLARPMSVAEARKLAEKASGRKTKER